MSYIHHIPVGSDQTPNNKKTTFIICAIGTKKWQHPNNII